MSDEKLTQEEKSNAVHSKYRTSRKGTSSENINSSIKRMSGENLPYRVNVISHSRTVQNNEMRMLSPVDAQRRRQKMTGKTGNNNVRKMRRPARHLSLRAAPPVPTAPKDPLVRQTNWIISQIRLLLSEIDLPLVVCTFLLCITGLFAIHSATLTMKTHRLVIVQFCALALGFGIAALLSAVDYRQLAKKYRLLIGINAAILIFTYFFGQSVTESSNANWINLGFIKIQPSEFAKLLFIFTFSVHLSHVRDRLNKISTVITLFVHAGIIFGLVFLQKDLGSLTIFLLIFVAMCFAAGLSVWYYIGGGAVIFCMMPFLWSKLSNYQKNRILLCFDDSIDPSGIGIRYQQMRSQTAIGNGGIMGTGYMQGTVTQALSDKLPAKHTDMIFSTICEETGIIGAVIVLGIMAYLIYRIIKISINCTNRSGRYICVGVAAMLMIQVIENVGMCLGVMPVIGITFPFLSYGGSSALSTFIAIGMVLSVCTHKENTFFE